MCSLCSTLEGNGIIGEIPEELGNLSNLTNLNLGNNRLTGEIPSSLGNLKKLRFLILNQNNLTGTIPESLSSLLPSLISLFTGNGLNCGRNFPHLCASDNDSGGSHKPKIGLIVGIVGGLIGLLLFATVLFFLWKGSCRGYKREVYVDVAGL
ncbi:putative LRR receptor-like serine/threonine-protein kinase [Vitis vinifera]|uniref:Putative LRR receptor-like serine/threonine-protein kinase n=1 Tax=Vitis vinifera TaxID=29760 RepID=A0A438KQ50_VITVI|nr:putative LRR receptor-like serine/threonine-protein kinase [Vitis vinifera]